MKSISRIAVVVLFTFISGQALYSQEKKAIPVFTADSLKSGNYKDVFLSFFQLAFENLAGPRKELKFTANPYAIMMRADPELAVDTSYIKYTALRNLNFAFALRLDSNFKFNGFTSGVNYSLVNRRDYTVYREFLDSVNKRASEYFKMTEGVTQRRSLLLRQGKPSLSFKLRDQWDALTHGTKFTLDMVDDSVMQILLDSIAIPEDLSEFKKLLEARQKINIKKRMDSIYRDEKEVFKNRLLWTVGITDTTYQDQFFFSNVVFHTQLLKGFTRPRSQNQVEFDVKGTYNIIDDTLRAGRDLGRGILNFEGGINYVRRHRSTDISFFEFKASASYKRIFSGIYTGEHREIFTLNGTFRFRIYEEIWIPLEFEYDPKTGNVFGFLNVRVNFTALRKAIGKNMGL